MERENPLKFIACAAAALVAGVAFSAAVSDNFEEEPIPSGWGTSDATIVSETVETVGGGFAISGDHNKVLSVSGEATRTSGIESDANQGQADFLVNITEASDSETFDSTPGEGVQIAIAAGSTITDPVSPATLGTVPLRIYCKAKSSGVLADNPGWLTEGPSVTTGAWHRVSLVFNYTAGLCKVSVDGKPYVSPSGFLKADKIDTTTSGAWYGLANTSGDTGTGKITSLSFVGAAKVDDVVIDAAETVTETYSGNSSVTVDGLAVSYENLNKWGVDGNTIGGVYLDNSGLSVAQKVVAGLDPTDGSTFTAKAMKMTNSTTATIALPDGIETAGRTYTVNYTADGQLGTVDNVTPVDGVLTVENLPGDAEVLTFTISVSAKQN